MAEHTDPRCSTTIIPDRLVLCALTRLPVETPSAHFFSIDDSLRYEPFFDDFGPLNINLAYKFCQILIAKLAAPEHANKVIYFYCANRPQNRSNAAVLVGIYLIVYGGRTSAAAYEPLKALEPYMPFRDASQQLCTFRLMPQHCLRAVSKALKLGWLDFDNWNSALYQHFESPDHGDLNVIVPGKFLAFSGPHASNISPEGYPTLTPADYLPIFQMFGVKHVIRLNKKCYERRDFLSAGIGHTDLFHPDGSTPSQTILDKFLTTCETVQGMIAVHCKAGLGRTGTTVGCYLMKHYHLSAAEAIAWMRLCRPGCVIGCQQHYLKLQEPRMWKLGKALGTPAAMGSGSVASGASVASSSSSPARDGHSLPELSSSHGVSSSTSPDHPDPMPLYSNSQPNSPQSPLSPAGSSQPSYSASFDTPPSMHQQRINGGAPKHHHHAHHGSSSSAAAAASSSSAAAASTPASAHPQTRSMTAALHSRTAASPPVLGALNTRGRSKAPRDLASSDESQNQELAAGSSPLALRHGSSLAKSKTGPSSPNSGGSAAAAAAARNLFDNKTWLQQQRGRAPSANGLRRGAAPLGQTAPVSPSQLSSLQAASMYLQQSSMGGGVVKKTRSSSQAPAGSSSLGAFRQQKARGL